MKEHGPVVTGGTAYTGAGKLDCAYIIHTVGPKYHEHSKEISEHLLQNSVLSSLQMAD